MHAHTVDDAQHECLFSPVTIGSIGEQPLLASEVLLQDLDLRAVAVLRFLKCSLDDNEDERTKLIAIAGEN